MKKFLAIYIGTASAFEAAGWNSMNEEERQEKQQAGTTAWGKWVETNRNSIVDLGTPLGMTKRISKRGIADTKNDMAAYVIVPGSTLAMSFMLPIELLDPEVRPWVERAAEGARASGTPFISFFTPAEMLVLARDAGFKEVRHISAAMLAQRYFANRADGLRPPNNSEEMLVATA